jgi:hypothetical protein
VPRGAKTATFRDAHDANAAWTAIPISEGRSIRPDSGLVSTFETLRITARSDTLPLTHWEYDGGFFVDASVSPQCGHCGGMLKPDVVFFGEGIPRTRVDAARAALEEADAMLVVGSSLMVYSGYRLCEHAHGMGKPIAAINRGRTRADHLFTLKVEHGCGEVLTDLVETLSAVPSLV